MSGRAATTDRRPGRYAISVGRTEMPSPQGWSWVELQQVARLESGHTPSRRYASYWNGGIPWIGIKDARNHHGRRIFETLQTVSQEGLDNSAARLLPAGTVCLSRTASVGYALVMGESMATSQDFVNWVCSEAVDPEFLMHLLIAEKESLLRFGKGTTHTTIYYPEVKAFHVCLPPKREQRAIVEAIESYFTRLDDAVATLERVQRNLKRYRASVLKAAVEGRLVPTEAELARAEGRDYEPASVLLERILAERRRRWEEAELAKMKATGKTPKDDRWKAKYKEPNPPEKRHLPQLPEGWCWSSLGQMFEVCVGATPSRKRDEYWTGGIPWVSSGEVSFCRIARTRETISEAGLRNSSTKLNPAGSVLLGMIGEGKTRGQVAILDVPACNNQNCAALWVGETEMPPEYIYYFLVEQYEVTRTRGSGNNQPALNKSRVQAIPVPVPPAAEARRIVSFIETHESAVEPMGQSARHAILRAGRLRQSILKWAFEGRLVDQDPNDEPASQLLERIQAERESTKSNPRRNRRPTARSTET